MTISECMVHPETDGSHAYHLDLSVPGSLPSFTYTADAIRRHGSIPSVELSHSGQFSGTYLADKNKKQGLAQWGPSAGVRADGLEIGELTKEMIDDIVAAYGKTAALAKRAGFEMVMVHGGHGWLINQSSSTAVQFPLRNELRRRLRKPRAPGAGNSEVGAREAGTTGIPDRVPHERRRIRGRRLSSGRRHPHRSGRGRIRGSHSRLRRNLSEQPSESHIHPGLKITDAMSDLAAEIKKHVKKPVATLGGLNDPAMMEEIMASRKGRTWCRGNGRSRLLADPELLRTKLYEGQR